MGGESQPEGDGRSSGDDPHRTEADHPAQVDDDPGRDAILGEIGELRKRFPWMRRKQQITDVEFEIGSQYL